MKREKDGVRDIFRAARVLRQAAASEANCTVLSSIMLINMISLD